VQQAVAIEHRVAQARIHQLLVEPLVVGAFRQPDAQRSLAQLAFVFAHSIEQLGAHRLRHLAQEGQVAVGGAAGDQVHHALLLQLAEAGHQLALVVQPLLHHLLELLGQVGGGGGVARPGLAPVAAAAAPTRAGSGH
jgi:hypothetical protein